MILSSLVFVVAASFGGFAGSQEVQFAGADGVKLNGTLSRPAAKFSGPRPAVLLLPGSGPTDRDGNSPQMGVYTDLLKGIAEKLTAEGFVTLRFDKRATPAYRALWPHDLVAMGQFFAWEKFVGDAEGGLKYLAKLPDVARNRIALLGHSEGSLISIQIAHDWANEPRRPACIVLLGATGRPMGAVIHDQLVGQLGKSGLPAEKCKELIDYSDRACADLAARKPLPAGTPRELAGLFNLTVVPIMGSYCRLDPPTLAKVYPGNVLLMNGTDDTQVSAIKDTPLLRRALESRTSGKVRTVLVPAVSHNFKSTADGNRDAFSGPISPLLLNTVGDYLKGELKP